MNEFRIAASKVNMEKLTPMQVDCALKRYGYFDNDIGAVNFLQVTDYGSYVYEIISVVDKSTGKVFISVDESGCLIADF
jgi:hypothetical protein